MASQTEISSKLGITVKTFQDLIAKGYIEQRDRGNYTYEECSKQYLDHLREIAAGRMTVDGLDLSAERARLAKEQADAKEMENMVERGDLLYIDDIIKDFEEQLINCKTKLLSAPTKVAAEVFAARDVAEVQEIMEEAVKDALSELVGYRQEQAA
jgi:phage terminase Nu1 subunit (DNA packaging protein)